MKIVKRDAIKPIKFCELNVGRVFSIASNLFPEDNVFMKIPPVKLADGKIQKEFNCINLSNGTVSGWDAYEPVIVVEAEIHIRSAID